jgi:hypothetical protein
MSNQTVTECGIETAYTHAVIQLFTVLMQSANDPQAATHFKNGLLLAQQTRAQSLQIASETQAP